MLGLDVAAKATDGHTLALGFNGPVAFAPFLYRKMPYDPARDLVPVIMTTSQPNVLAVNADKVPARNVAEFGIIHFLQVIHESRKLLIPIIEPILNPLWVLLLMGETPSQWALIGGAIVLVAVTTRAVASLRSRATPETT